MTTLTVTLALAAPAAQADRSGAAVGEPAVTGSAAATVNRAAGAVTPRGDSRAAAPDTCPHARPALRFYARRAAEWRARMGAAVPPREALQAASSYDRPGRCPQLRRLALRAQARARAARAAWERHRTLRDFPVRPGANAWLRAVEEAQRPYPGTRAWLRSCSASEGGWGRWVRHGGGPYYPGLERIDVSSGWLQFKPGTFAGFYRHAVDDVRSRGFKVERLRALPDGWLSPLAQALAGAWGYVNGLKHHWVGWGCR